MNPLLGISKSALVGVAATILDLGTLTALVNFAGLSPQAANLPSLFLGSNVQFWGNRHYVFGAGAGHLGKQLAGFISIEAASFVLNAVIYYCLVRWTSINYVVARIIGSFLVFSCFSYPLWRLNFRINPWKEA